MEIERRGKYPGVKVHLDPEEIEAINKLADFLKIIDPVKSTSARPGQKLIIKLDSKIAAQVAEDPTTLAKRTEDEIRATLEKERDSAIKKLAAMDDGKEWHLGKPKGQDTFTG